MPFENAKAVFAKLMLDYPPVALKFTEEEPENIKKSDKQMSICKHILEARFGEGRFYIDKTNETCFAKIALGMVPKPPEYLAGELGYSFELYSSKEISEEYYRNLPVVSDRIINYVIFSRLDMCDFEPDLLLIFSDFKNAEILLRASTYNTGGFWESYSSPIMSCAWTLAYPMVSGKINYLSSSIPSDLSRSRALPQGLVISIPGQRLGEIVTALETMPWKPISFRADKKSKEEFKRRTEHWEETGKKINVRYMPLAKK